MWQIQALGQGAFAQGKTQDALIKRAATLTLENGYTHFILGMPQTNNSQTYGGFTPIQANTIGNNVYITGGQPIVVHQGKSSVMVLLLHSNDPKAQNAIDANTILRQLK